MDVPPWMVWALVTRHPTLRPTHVDQLRAVRDGGPTELAEANFRLAMKEALNWKRKGSRLPAEDLFQEAMIGMLKAARAWDRKRKFSTYACVVMRRHVRDRVIRLSCLMPVSPGTYRRKQVLPDQPVAVEPAVLASVPDTKMDQEEVLIASEPMAAITRGLRKLPTREQDIIAKRYCSGMTQKEVGAELGVSHQAVQQIEFRALRRIRQALLVSQGMGQ